ncbi:hypothetical protein JAAARDRAFT_52041 [Jaapia argillacea MUCL 33604]|uniref:Uncharacterized protein n=1 Tax=Jaapia argillacea MUCL 33604 TaxID=933084 RepID=A0A067QN00_9AGAM|nr:hypothetical protein JAAARDRAFT_52041 [Jaapia argillacea MUCL 33604]
MCRTTHQTPLAPSPRPSLSNSLTPTSLPSPPSPPLLLLPLISPSNPSPTSPHSLPSNITLSLPSLLQPNISFLPLPLIPPTPKSSTRTLALSSSLVS